MNKQPNSQPDGPLKPVISGFEHIYRYWNNCYDSVLAVLHPGQLYVTNHNELMTTTLGSCISACIRDPRLGVGGMNHFMLPVNNDYDGPVKYGACNTLPARYGNWAMELLINEIIKLGGDKRFLEIKIFGGSNFFGQTELSVARQNIRFVFNYARKENLSVSGQDVGGQFARRLIYNPVNGVVKMKKFTTDINAIVKKEKDYLNSIDDKPNDIDLFHRF